ncbi:metalloregulator ArsR/SmtB family transcription factor [Streptomyces sp. NBC_01549]|uniref:ArsR/SmtB family transcription factor n=1 Tax=Streptomyces sp. NBC_01549 TaxID=2975874 RepID=UPI002252FF42|nr:metalloregulator ArsR/SmtB family transcription factor [Streptomyces sp. NBC_01549]MCX4590769.1 metalloregulator ArsR/SmtB family transcription factor [Streptomyces sp. NBC_01549]
METQVRSWDAAGADRAVAVLKAVADPSRYRLLWALSGQELPVSALAEMIGAHVAATSQHLARLRAAGLVDSRREGTRIYYRAAARVRGLLEEATLVANASVDQAAGEDLDAGSVPAAVAQEGPARSRRVARAPRPATEH